MDIGIGWPGGDIASTLRLVALVVCGYGALIWAVTVIWVYRDIRARTRDIVSHLTALAIALAFPIVGLPLYFVLRPRHTLEDVYSRQLEQEAMLSELHAASACPRCRRPVEDDFMVCPHCRTQLRLPCPGCPRLLSPQWRHCPYCAAPRPRPAAEQEAPADHGGEGAPAPARAGSGAAGPPRTAAAATRAQGTPAAPAGEATRGAAQPAGRTESPGPGGPPAAGGEADTGGAPRS